MESSESSQLTYLGDNNTETIILTLPTTFQADEQPSSNSSLVRSECGQVFLVTYDETNRIVSKHQIHLQINNDDFFELKCGGTTDLNDSVSRLVSELHTSDEQNEFASVSGPLEDRYHNGDTLQLAMQEIDGNEADLLEPVSYEVKLAALNAMIPTGETTSGQNIFNCAICSKTYDRKYELKSHLSRHFGLNIFLCPVCGRQFSHSSNLSRHMRIHSGVKPYKCKDCGKRFNQANSLHTHRAYIHPNSNQRHSCPLCGRLYKTLQLLKRHCKINHQDEPIDLNIPTSSAMSKRQFYCTECGESFVQKSQLTRHKETDHANVQSDEVQSTIEMITSKDTQCMNDVQLNFDAMDSIDSMLREIQDDNNPPMSMDLVLPKLTDTLSQTIEDVIEKVNKFVCFECGKQFPRYMSYKQHWGVHETSMRKFECKECGMSFAWKSTFVKHTLQFHSSEPQSVLFCNEPDCGKEYKSLNQLQEHVKRDHLRIRRFTCDECHKQFYKAHDLLVHKRTHSKEKPYMCGTCGKSFSHISHVIRHEKSHNNVRPYTCPVCQKSFTQATVLKAHRNKKCPDIVTTVETPAK